MGKHPVTLWQEPGEIVEQSSDQIWQAVCAAERMALQTSAVGPSVDPLRNVIVWMGHRAHAEAEEINAGGHRVLDYIGARISPEMETPKLLWLGRHMPETFAKAAQVFDLSDYPT